MRRFIFGFLAAALFALPAMADEVWTSREVGRVIWETDVNDTSVFAYETPTGRTVKMYVEGLPGNAQNRNVMTGYWLMQTDGPGEGQCSAGLTAVDGTTSYTWGRFDMRWERRAFPSGWTARLTECFAGPANTIRAHPHTAQ